MNNDLISREALKKALNELFESGGYDSGLVMNTIDHAPTVEPCKDCEDKRQAEYIRHGSSWHELQSLRKFKEEHERPHGEWIVTAEDNDGVHRICCPFCSYEKGSNNTDNIIVTFHNFPKFCENCGADMRKGGKK